MVTDIFHHPIELQSQVARHVKRAQIILKRDAAILFLVPFQCIEHHIAEPVDEPGLQTDIRRVILQRLPVMLHQVDGILMSQRHKVQIFLLSQLIPLIKDIIACLTIPVEILSDNVGISLTESTDNSLF